ncbi:paraspeckle component 1 [Amia ocellicauda]|uniref:paraspeckle component 1 n=1 Tax=Amia ocellicauda TaxID=2972642 RepID=UPI003464ABBF
MYWSVSEGEESSDSDCEYEVKRESFSREEFCQIMEETGRSWAKTHENLLEYYKDLIERRDSSRRQIAEQEEKIQMLKEKGNYLTKIKDQILEMVRYIERRMFLTSEEIRRRQKIISEELQRKQLLLNHLEEKQMRHEAMEAEVEALRRQLYLSLRKKYGGHSRSIDH